MSVQTNNNNLKMVSYESDVLSALLLLSKNTSSSSPVNSCGGSHASIFSAPHHLNPLLPNVNTNNTNILGGTTNHFNRINNNFSNLKCGFNTITSNTSSSPPLLMKPKMRHTTQFNAFRSSSSSSSKTTTSTQRFYTCTLNIPKTEDIISKIQTGTFPEKKKRQRATAQQIAILEKIFAIESLPSQKIRSQLAEKLNMTKKRVQIWFQNRRAKWRRSQRAQENLKESRLNAFNASSAFSSPQQFIQHPSKFNLPLILPGPTIAPNHQPSKFTTSTSPSSSSSSSSPPPPPPSSSSFIHTHPKPKSPSTIPNPTTPPPLPSSLIIQKPTTTSQLNNIKSSPIKQQEQSTNNTPYPTTTTTTTTTSLLQKPMLPLPLPTVVFHKRSTNHYKITNKTSNQHTQKLPNLTQFCSTLNSSKTQFI